MVPRPALLPERWGIGSPRGRVGEGSGAAGGGCGRLGWSPRTFGSVLGTAIAAGNVRRRMGAEQCEPRADDDRHGSGSASRAILFGELVDLMRVNTCEEERPDWRRGRRLTPTHRGRGITAHHKGRPNEPDPRNPGPETPTRPRRHATARAHDSSAVFVPSDVKNERA